MRMIAVRIPTEIRSYKEKIFAGLTARQLVAVMAIVAIGAPLYYYGKPMLGEDKIEMLVLVVLAPIGAVGFFPYKYGMKPEIWFKLLFRYYFLVPKKRKFISKNFFDFRKIKSKKVEKV